MRSSLRYWRCLQAGASGMEAPQLPGLAVMAFWPQLSGRLGSVSRGMCHHPTARAVTGDGWGENSEEPILTYSSFSESSCLCQGALPVFGFSSGFPPLSDSKLSMSGQTALPPYWGMLLCVGGQPLEFLSHAIPQDEAEKCLWTWELLQAGFARAPTLQPALPSGMVELIKVMEEQLSY